MANMRVLAAASTGNQRKRRLMDEQHDGAETAAEMHITGTEIYLAAISRTVHYRHARHDNSIATQ